MALCTNGTRSTSRPVTPASPGTSPEGQSARLSRSPSRGDRGRPVRDRTGEARSSPGSRIDCAPTVVSCSARGRRASPRGFEGLHESISPIAPAYRRLASPCSTMPSAAIAHLQMTEPPYVIKTDGLAAGKGVLVTHDLRAAEARRDRQAVGAWPLARQGGASSSKKA